MCLDLLYIYLLYISLLFVQFITMRILYFKIYFQIVNQENMVKIVYMFAQDIEDQMIYVRDLMAAVQGVV